MNINKEQFEILDKHSKLLMSVRATKTYVGVDRMVLNELHRVYVELGYRATNLACGNCVIGFLLTLGGLYVTYKDSFHSESEPQQSVSELEKSVTNKEPKKTRKKK